MIMYLFQIRRQSNYAFAKFIKIVIIAVIAILSILLMNHCTPDSDTGKSEQNDTTSKIITIKRDLVHRTYGRDSLTSGQIFESWVNKYHLMRGSKKKFLKVFGKPNQIYKLDDKEVLVYYFGDCNNFIIEPKFERAYFDAIFINNILVKTAHRIE